MSDDKKKESVSRRRLRKNYPYDAPPREADLVQGLELKPEESKSYGLDDYMSDRTFC